MASSQPPLDPRKTPWKRGDVCTLGFKKSGFVLNHTPEYLEVRWMPNEGIERIPAEDIDNVLRVMHADSPSPDGTRTNLESLEIIESLSRVSDAVTERMKSVKDPAEKKEIDALIARSFGPKCAFDRKHGNILFDLAIDPRQVSWYWKLRERIHRVVHHH
jgi:hypothetical protein